MSVIIDCANPIIRESDLNKAIAGRWMAIHGRHTLARISNLANRNPHGRATSGLAVSTWPTRGRGRGKWPSYNFAGAATPGYFALSPSINLGTSYTICAWIALASATTNPIIGSTVFGGMYLTAGLLFHDTGSERPSVSYSPPTDGTWIHVTITRDYDKVRYYVNGRQVGSTQTLATPTTTLTLASIGETNGGGIITTGEIQDVFVARRMMSDSQVLRMYRDGLNDYRETLRRVDLNWYSAGAVATPWHLFGGAA